MPHTSTGRVSFAGAHAREALTGVTWWAEIEGLGQMRGSEGAGAWRRKATSFFRWACEAGDLAAQVLGRNGCTGRRPCLQNFGQRPPGPSGPWCLGSVRGVRVPAATVDARCYRPIRRWGEGLLFVCASHSVHETQEMKRSKVLRI